MVLQRKELEIPLTGGRDVKTSDELQDPNTSRTVTNLRWDGSNELVKRPTYASEAALTVPSNGNYTSVRPEMIFTQDNTPCVLTDHYGLAYVNPADSTALLYAGGETATSYAYPRYEPRACTVSRRQLERTQFGAGQGGIYEVASAVYSNFLVVAWMEVGNTSYAKYRAFDLTTGAAITPVGSTSVSGTLRCVCATPYHEGGKQGVLITYCAGSSAPYTISSVYFYYLDQSFHAGSNLTTNAKYARHTLQGTNSSVAKAYLTFTDNTSGFITCQLRTISTITTTHTANHTGFPGATIIGPNNVLVTSSNSPTVYAEVFGSPANKISAYTGLGTGTDLTFQPTGCLEGSAGADRAILYFSCYESAAPTYNKVNTITVDFSTTTPVTGQGSFIPNAWIATQAFTVNGRAHIGVQLDVSGDGTPTSIVITRYAEVTANSRAFHSPVARVLHNRAYTADIGVFGQFPSVTVSLNSAYCVLPGDPGEESGPASQFGGFLPQSIFLSKVSFSSQKPLPNLEIDRVAHLASGMLIEHDGDQLTDSMPCCAPTVKDDFSSGTGTTFSHTVYFRAIYRWVDKQGRLHRSAPSEPCAVPAFTNKQLKIYVSAPPFRPYNTLFKTALEPELYATEDTATPGNYYLVSDASTPPRKVVYDTDYPSDLVYFKYTGAVAGVAGNEQLYSTGADTDELVPQPPPSFRSIARVGDVVWGINAEDTSELWYSKPYSSGDLISVEWNANNRLSIPDDCVAVTDNNGLPTVLATRGIWQVYGEGPDATGAASSGSFSTRRLPHEVGCLDPLIARTGLGTFFQGRRGFYLLDNGLGLQPIGLPIDPVTRAPTQAAYVNIKPLWDETHNEIRVENANNSGHYVLNVVEGKWSLWTNSTSTQFIADMTMVDGRVWYIHNNGSTATVRREYGVDESGHRTSTEGWSLTTAKYKLDGLVGFGRVWDVEVLLKPGDTIANVNSLTISYTTDGPESGTDTFTWSGSDLATMSNQILLRFKPRNQRCRSFKLTITETCTGAYSGSSPVMVRLGLGVDSKALKQTRQAALKGST